MTFLVRFWPHLLVGAAILGAGVWINRLGYESGYNDSEAKWKPAFDAANTALAVAEARTDTREAQSKLISARREAEHAAIVSSLSLRISDAERTNAGLVRKLTATTASRSPLPSDGRAVSEPHDTTAGAELAERAGIDLTRLAGRCESDAAQLVALQGWVLDQLALQR